MEGEDFFLYSFFWGSFLTPLLGYLRGFYLKKNLVNLDLATNCNAMTSAEGQS